MTASVAHTPPPAGTPPVERRASPRHPILQRCIVWPPGASGPEGWRSIAYNISATGIAVVLPLPLPNGAVVRIEPWGLAARPLAARVVRSSMQEFAWFCGCELLEPLDAGELLTWITARPAS